MEFSYAYGLNHFEVDENFKRVLKVFWNEYEKEYENLMNFGKFAGTEIYEWCEWIDRTGGHIFRMFSPTGDRIDFVWVNPLLKVLLEKINEYKMNAKSLFYHYALGYLVADPGLYCILTLSHQVGRMIRKYKPEMDVWKGLLGLEKPYFYGGTFFTEAKSGSDLSLNETYAEKDMDFWRIKGEKYFTSNVGIADYALVSAKFDKEKGIKGLACFIVPKYFEGKKNYRIRRLKDKSATKVVPTGEIELDSVGWLLGDLENGIYYILECLMYSRLDNAIGALGCAQKSLIEAEEFAKRRKIFGNYLINQPLMKKELQYMKDEILKGLLITFKAILEFEKSLDEKPPYSTQYHYARFLTHIVKNRTAEISVKITQRAMEILGGFGFLNESTVERWHRESLVMPIWEGTSIVQAQDMFEVLKKKNIRERIFEDLRGKEKELEDAFKEEDPRELLIKLSKIYEDYLYSLIRN